jgi:hypothetical protein
MQTKAPYDDGSSKGGTYISNQVRMHACHLTLKHYTYFLFCFVARKILNVVQQDWGPKKEKKEKKEGRIIELIITENHGCDLETGRR